MPGGGGVGGVRASGTTSPRQWHGWNLASEDTCGIFKSDVAGGATDDPYSGRQGGGISKVEGKYL